MPSWQPSLISFNTHIESGSIIKPCTLKHFQVPILAPGLDSNSAAVYNIPTKTVEENTKIRNVTKDRNFGAKITYVSNISNLHNYENQ